MQEIKDARLCDDEWENGWRQCLKLALAQFEWIMQWVIMTSHCPRPACECFFGILERKFLFLSIQIHPMVGQTTMYLVSLENSLKI